MMIANRARELLKRHPKITAEWLVETLEKEAAATPTLGDMVMMPREPTKAIVDAMETVEHPNNHAAFYCELYAAAVAAAAPASPIPTSVASGAGEPMTLEVALDFAENPRLFATLQAPADSMSELREALSVIAIAYRALSPATLDNTAVEGRPDREDVARVLFDQRQTQHDFDDAADADPESDAGTLRSIAFDDADAVLTLFPAALTAETEKKS